MTAACGDKAGTLAGVSRHRRAWDPACDACKKAAADYQRRRRQSSPKVAADARDESARRHWAIKRLIGRHRGEFADLLSQARGLPL